jgi:hypothetical protein
LALQCAVREAQNVNLQKVLTDLAGRSARPQKGKWFAAACVVLILWTSVMAVPLGAQNGEFPSEKRVGIEKAVSNFMAANSVPGVSVAVVQSRELVWSEGFGMPDLESFVPALWCSRTWTTWAH